MNALHVSALLALAMVAGCASQQKPQPSAQSSGTPMTTPIPAYVATTPAFHEGTEARHEHFNAISKEGTAKLVFLGDSITEGWEHEGAAAWEKHYGSATGRHAANFGIGGDRTEHVLWRLEHGNFDGLSPKLIVLMIGTNNAGHRKDPAVETEAGIRAILDRLQAKCPQAKILLLAIFPRGEALDDPYRLLNEQVNAAIRGYADGKRVRFVDIGKNFVDEKGLPRKDLMPDMLHLSPEAYELWAAAIEKDVEWGMGKAK